MCRYWRRFSIFFLASLVFCCADHAGLAGQVAQSATAQRPLISSLLTQESPSRAVQQGVEQYQLGKFTEAIAEHSQSRSVLPLQEA